MPATPCAFRSTLAAGDDDRAWLYAWSRAGNLSPAWTLAGKPATPFRFASTNSDDWWHRSYHGGVRLPAGATPGSATLTCGPGLTLPVNVVAVPKRPKTTTIPAGGNAAAVTKALQQGNLVVTLAPGEHAWEAPVDTRPYPWAMLRGYGATVRVLANGVNTNPAILPGDYLGVYGVTFVSDVPAQLFLGDPTARGGVVADCTLRRCHLGWGFADVLVRDTTFIDCGVNNAPTGMYLHCRFVGSPGQGWYSITSASRVGSIAVVGATFDHCDRGLVVNTMYGDVSDNLFVRLEYNACTYPDGELFLVEGQGKGFAFDRNVIAGLHATACPGSLVQLDEVARNNLIAWPWQDAAGRGVVLGSPWTDGIVPGKDVSGNEFACLNGWVPRVTLGAAATGNTADGRPLVATAVQ